MRSRPTATWSPSGRPTPRDASASSPTTPSTSWRCGGGRHRAVAGLLGELVALAGPRGLVIFMGAWGHRLVHSKVHLNAVLARSGDLCFRRHPRTQLKRAMFRLGVTSASAERLAHRLNL